jgi:5-formyltetrahydrofolate cyclo-ligase
VRTFSARSVGGALSPAMFARYSGVSPRNASAIEMTICFVVSPGLAFAVDGRRLGRGKGFYDRMLAAVDGLTCGVAFDEQLVEELPVDPHDIRVSWILTPTRLVRANPGAG